MTVTTVMTMGGGQDEASVQGQYTLVARIKYKWLMVVDG
jgi:hypothetical protein